MIGGAGLFGGVNRIVFEALNGLVGRSWALDNLIALSIDNVFVKAGPIGACFFYAWYSRGGRSDDQARRPVLLVTLLSLYLIAPTTKTMSENMLMPRPFVLAGQSHALRDGELVEVAPVAYRVPQSGDARRRVEELREGRLDGNDVVTFPSDHAAFFTALSLGIFLASRIAGAIALAWTMLVVLAGRIAVGMHWPLDIAAGALIGAATLLLLQFGFARFGRGSAAAAAAWMERHPGVGAGILFLVLLEAANTMQTLKQLLEMALAIAGRLL